MTISCPQCHTKYLVPKEQIDAIGRKVKCTKCKHVWHQTASMLGTATKQVNSNKNLNNKITQPKQNIAKTPVNNQTTSNKVIKPIVISNKPIISDNKNNLPVVVSVVKAPYSNPILSTLSLFMVVVLLLLIIFYEKLNVFALSPVSNNKMLVLEDIHAFLNKATGKINLSCKVRNNYNHEVIIPSMKVKLFDEQQILLKSYILDKKDIKLSAGQHIEINSDLNFIPDSSRLVNIMIGNNLDFILQ